mmetsp:Transcript_8387/g.14334  ORF Transcript_8387/g.14334 Transcript_8387/m.14334 type:complete len:103 (+) Transcript_8387:115-423(+)
MRSRSRRGGCERSWMGGGDDDDDDDDDDVVDRTKVKKRPPGSVRERAGKRSHCPRHSSRICACRGRALGHSQRGPEHHPNYPESTNKRFCHTRGRQRQLPSK